MLNSGKGRSLDGKCAVYRVDDNEAKAVAAVFEGSGKYSEVEYAEFDNRTGANIGSRIAAAATLNCCWLPPAVSGAFPPVCRLRQKVCYTG